MISGNAPKHSGQHAALPFAYIKCGLRVALSQDMARGTYKRNPANREGSTA